MHSRKTFFDNSVFAELPIPKKLSCLWPPILLPAYVMLAHPLSPPPFSFSVAAAHNIDHHFLLNSFQITAPQHCI